MRGRQGDDYCIYTAPDFILKVLFMLCIGERKRAVAKSSTLVIDTSLYVGELRKSREIKRVISARSKAERCCRLRVYEFGCVPSLFWDTFEPQILNGWLVVGDDWRKGMEKEREREISTSDRSMPRGLIASGAESHPFSSPNLPAIYRIPLCMHLPAARRETF